MSANFWSEHCSGGKDRHELQNNKAHDTRQTVKEQRRNAGTYENVHDMISMILAGLFLCPPVPLDRIPHAKEHVRRIANWVNRAYRAKRRGDPLQTEEFFKGAAATPIELGGLVQSAQYVRTERICRGTPATLSCQSRGPSVCHRPSHKCYSRC